MAADTRDQSIPVAVEAVIERMVRLKKEYDDCQRFLDSLGIPDDERKGNDGLIRAPEQDNTRITRDLQQKLSEANNKIKELEKENKALQDTAIRINHQLSRYVRITGRSFEYDNTTALPTRVCSKSVTKLSAILSAYEELFQERDEMLRLSTKKLEELLLQFTEISKENEKLHERLNVLKKGVPIGSEESRDVAHNARLLLEERDILQEEREIFQEHIKSLQQHILTSGQKAQQEKVELERRVAETEAANKALSEEASKRREVNRLLENQLSKCRQDLENKYSAEEHDTAVNKLGNEIMRLKKDFERRRKEFERLIDEAKEASEKAKMEVTELKAQKKKFQGEIAARDKILKKRNRTLKKHERTLRQNESNKRILGEDIDKLRDICQKLLDDRADLLKNQTQLIETGKKLESQTLQEQEQISFLKKKMESDCLAYKRNLAENTGAYKQVQKDLKKSSKENLDLKKQIRRKDVQIKAMMSEFRFLGLDLDGKLFTRLADSES